jgi:hypothetical protein
MNDLILKLDSIFGKKAPQLPPKLKEFIVKFGPYVLIISLIFVLIGLLGLLFAFIPMMLGASVVVGAAASSSFYGTMTKVLVSFAFTIVASVMELVALPGLFKRTSKAWNLIFYATLVSLLGSLVTFNFIGFIISGLISFYILFQIRPYYMGGVVENKAQI